MTFSEIKHILLSYYVGPTEEFEGRELGLHSHKVWCSLELQRWGLRGWS